MGWDRTEARQIKAQAAEYVAEILTGRDVAVADRWGGAPIGTTPGPMTAGIALGLAPAPDGSYEIAVRYRLGTPTARMLARRLADQIGDGLNVRHTGRVYLQAPAVANRPGRGARPTESGGTSIAPAVRPPAQPRAQSQELTERTRPLRPGISVAHLDVTAGTLGAFVYDDAGVHVLSNHHVLVGQGGIGDVVLQPGPADGGTDPEDRIGTVAGLVELVPGQVATVDAAVAGLDAELAGEIDPTYPGGQVRGTTEVAGGEQVQKIGRTTGHTHGVVTAIELDGLLVDFGPGLGTLAFDGQIEVEGIDGTTFSDGGDSGSLVYAEQDMAAVGLLFAGSAIGGDSGQGLTFLNPISAVLDELEMSLDPPDNGGAGGGGAGGPDLGLGPVGR